MNPVPALLFFAGAVVFAISVGKRLFGAYGYSATTEDAIAILLLGTLGYFVFGYNKPKDDDGENQEG